MAERDGPGFGADHSKMEIKPLLRGYTDSSHLTAAPPCQTLVGPVLINVFGLLSF